MRGISVRGMRTRTSGGGPSLIAVSQEEEAIGRYVMFRRPGTVAPPLHQHVRQEKKPRDSKATAGPLSRRRYALCLIINGEKGWPLLSVVTFA